MNEFLIVYYVSDTFLGIRDMTGNRIPPPRRNATEEKSVHYENAGHLKCDTKIMPYTILYIVYKLNSGIVHISSLALVILCQPCQNEK